MYSIAEATEERNGAGCNGGGTPNRSGPGGGGGAVGSQSDESGSEEPVLQTPSAAAMPAGGCFTGSDKSKVGGAGGER